MRKRERERDRERHKNRERRGEDCGGKGGFLDISSIAGTNEEHGDISTSFAPLLILVFLLFFPLTHSLFFSSALNEKHLLAFLLVKHPLFRPH